MGHSMRGRPGACPAQVRALTGLTPIAQQSNNFTRIVTSIGKTSAKSSPKLRELVPPLPCL